MKGLTQCVLAVGLLCSSPIFAANTGKELAEWGETYDQKKMDSPFQGGAYLGYVSAVADAFNGTAFCAPGDVTYAQLAAISLKHLRNNPEVWNHNGAGLVLDALTGAFPCKKK